MFVPGRQFAVGTRPGRSLRLVLLEKVRRKRLKEVRRLLTILQMDVSECPSSYSANILARRGSENLMAQELGAAAGAACIAG